MVDMTHRHAAAEVAAAPATAAAEARKSPARGGTSPQPEAPRQSGGSNPGMPPVRRQRLSMFDRALLGPAIVDALRKLDPRVQWRNPVMFVVYIGSILTTGLWIQALGGKGEAPA